MGCCAVGGRRHGSPAHQRSCPLPHPTPPLQASRSRASPPASAPSCSPRRAPTPRRSQPSRELGGCPLAAQPRPPPLPSFATHHTHICTALSPSPAPDGSRCRVMMQQHPALCSWGDSTVNPLNESVGKGGGGGCGHAVLGGEWVGGSLDAEGRHNAGRSAPVTTCGGWPAALPRCRCWALLRSGGSCWHAPSSCPPRGCCARG